MKLIEAVERAFCGVSKPAPHELKAVITRLELTPEKAAPYITEPSGLPYGRNALFVSDEVEVILVHLPRGSRTRIHDHGASVGCAYILEGELTNTVYRLDNYGYAHEYGSTVLQTGQFLYAPQGQIHQMSNMSSERMLSFHVYTPRLTDTKVYRTYGQVLDYVI